MRNRRKIMFNVWQKSQLILDFYRGLNLIGWVSGARHRAFKKVKPKHSRILSTNSWRQLDPAKVVLHLFMFDYVENYARILKTARLSFRWWSLHLCLFLKLQPINRALMFPTLCYAKFSIFLMFSVQYLLHDKHQNKSLQAIFRLKLA